MPIRISEEKLLEQDNNLEDASSYLLFKTGIRYHCGQQMALNKNYRYFCKICKWMKPLCP